MLRKGSYASLTVPLQRLEATINTVSRVAQSFTRQVGTSNHSDQRSRLVRRDPRMSQLLITS